jgi:hypothetical protein
MNTEPLLSLTGEIDAVGNLQPEDIPALDTPRVLILLDGQPMRHVLIAGLTQEECRAVASVFMEQVRLTVGRT